MHLVFAFWGAVWGEMGTEGSRAKGRLAWKNSITTSPTFVKPIKSLTSTAFPKPTFLLPAPIFIPGSFMIWECGYDVSHSRWELLTVAASSPPCSVGASWGLDAHGRVVKVSPFSQWLILLFWAFSGSRSSVMGWIVSLLTLLKNMLLS